MPDELLQPIIKQYQASDGYWLHYRHWQPEDEPRGYVVALHGIQSHSGWYDFSSRMLCEAGFDVRFADRRGSGMNAESRGHTPHEDRLVSDVVQLLSDVRYQRNQLAPTLPVILLAVSWGGKLAAITCAKRPELVDKLVLLYPGICTQVSAKPHQRAALRVAESLGFADSKINLPLDDPTLFTAESSWQDYIEDDDLALHQATVSFLASSCRMDKLAAEAPAQIRCPTLMMLAGKDQIVNNSRTRDYFGALSSSQKTLVEYPQARHTLEFEPDREAIFQDLLEWLQSSRLG